jgi:hypothetical protein
MKCDIWTTGILLDSWPLRMGPIGCPETSVRIFQHISNKMHRYTVYFFWKLLYMFRVVPPPITRSAKTVSTTSGICHTFTATCRYSRAVGRGRAGRPDYDQQHCYHHRPKVKPEAATSVVELLMMGVRTPETCLAVNYRQVINWRSCCI